MSRCKALYVPKGSSKASVIKELINKKLQAEHNKKVPGIAKKTGIKDLMREIKKKEAALNKQKEILRECMERERIKECYEWDSTNNKNKTKLGADAWACYVPDDVNHLLQETIILRKLGKNSRAKAIEDSLIKKYKLTQIKI